MTYVELIAWAETKGMSETDLIEYEVCQDASALCDESFEEICSILRNGYASPNSEVCKERFEGKDEADQQEYMKYVLIEWQVK